MEFHRIRVYFCLPCGRKDIMLMNWGTQPQVYKKGIVVGHLEPANIVSRDDQIWKDFWEQLPDCSVEGVVRMYQTEN